MVRSLKSKRKVGCPVTVLPLLILTAGLAAAAGGLVLLAVRRPAGLPLFVQLSSPESGRQAELNRPPSLEAQARSLAGVTRLEVYADGSLVGTQDSTRTRPMRAKVRRPV